jgi:Zn finger protein HypA/HybF involved in hydrogenase expression
MARRTNPERRARVVWRYACGLGYRPDPKFNRRSDWAAVEAFYDAGRTVRECREQFGFANQTWNNAVKRGDARARARATPLRELLAVGARRHRLNVKRRMIDAGLKDDRCEECGIADWRGWPLSLALHHVNGDGRDNRLENLRLLCPNCHSQTENFAGRGVVRSIRARS